MVDLAWILIHWLTYWLAYWLILLYKIIDHNLRVFDQHQTLQKSWILCKIQILSCHLVSWLILGKVYLWARNLAHCHLRNGLIHHPTSHIINLRVSIRIDLSHLNRSNFFGWRWLYKRALDRLAGL